MPSFLSASMAGRGTVCRKIGGKILAKIYEGTGEYMRLWLNAFDYGSGTLFSPTPMPLLVWVPSALLQPQTWQALGRGYSARLGPLVEIPYLTVPPPGKRVGTNQAFRYFSQACL